MICSLQKKNWKRAWLWNYGKYSPNLGVSNSSGSRSSEGHRTGEPTDWSCMPDPTCAGVGATFVLIGLFWDRTIHSACSGHSRVMLYAVLLWLLQNMSWIRHRMGTVFSTVLEQPEWVLHAVHGVIQCTLLTACVSTQSPQAAPGWCSMGCIWPIGHIFKTPNLISYVIIVFTLSPVMHSVKSMVKCHW